MTASPQRTVRATAYVVCIREARILLSHQISVGPSGGQWTLPGGGLDFGEALADAAARECLEETGLVPTVGRPLGVHSATYVAGGVARQGIRLLFEGTFDTLQRPTPASPDDGEIDQVGWFPCDDLPTPITEWARLGVQLWTSSCDS